MTSIRLIGLAALVAALALAPAASATGVNTWHPADDGSLVSVAVQNDCPAHSTVPVHDGGTMTWVADLPAATDIDFGPDPFTFDLHLDAPFVGMATLMVGSVHPGSGAFTPFGVAPISGGGPLMTSGTFTTIGPQEVPHHHRLAFALHNDPDSTGGTDRRVHVHVGCPGTAFHSGATDPGYPTPELLTLGLVGAGGLVVAGLVARRRL